MVLRLLNCKTKYNTLFVLLDYTYRIVINISIVMSRHIVYYIVLLLNMPMRNSVFYDVKDYLTVLPITCEVHNLKKDANQHCFIPSSPNAFQNTFIILFMSFSITKG